MAYINYFKMTPILLFLFATAGCVGRDFDKTLEKSILRPFSEEERTLTLSGSTTQTEGGSFTLTATLDETPTSSVSISYVTENIETLGFQTRAEAVQDYTQVVGTLTFAPGQTTKTISIPTLVNPITESTRQFRVRFFNGDNIVMANSINEVTLNITPSHSPIFGANIEKITAWAGPSAAPEYVFPNPLTTFYVDQLTGADSNNGLSELAAFATLQKAADVATPGTLVLVKNGTYSEQVNIPTSGTAASPIVFKAFPGHAPIVTGSNALTGLSNLSGPPEESLSLFTTGFEGPSLDSSLSISDPTGDGSTTFSIDTESSRAAHGSQSALLTFPSASTANKGLFAIKSFGSTRPNGKGKLYFRTYVALNSSFALTSANRMDLIYLQGLDAADVTKNHVRVLIRKDGGNNRYLLEMQNSANGVMYQSSSTGVYLTPGAGYMALEVGFDNTDSTAPVKLLINGNSQTLTNQPNLASCLVNSVRFGAIHSSSSSIGYPVPAATLSYDSARISSTPIGSFNPVWPPTSVAGESFESGFGSLSKTEANGNTISLSTAQKKYGAQSALFEFSGTTAVAALTHSLTAREDVYVRFFLYLDNFDLANTNTSTSSNTSRWNLLTLSEGSTPRVALSLVKTTQGLKFDARVLTPDVTNISNYYKGYPGEIKTGEWYQVELRFKGNDGTSGGSEFWLNATGLGGNYDRTSNPDVYYGLDTSGMDIDTISLGDPSSGQSYSSTTYPTTGSKVYVDDYRLSSGAPSGMTPNSQNIQVHQASYSPSLYSGMGTTKPSVVIQTDASHPEGKMLHKVESKYVLTAGSFAVEGSNIYLRPLNDESLTGKSFEFGVRDVGFNVSEKDYIAIQGFNIRGVNHPNKGGVFLSQGAQNNWVIDNLIQAGAGAGVRLDPKLDVDEVTILRQADKNKIFQNHFRDNDLTFGSGIRINSSAETLIEHNLFESEVGTNISVECEADNICQKIVVRRNKFTSAGESSIYFAKYTLNSEVYGNWFYGARSSSYHTMKLGVRSSSGGSGVHIARKSHDNLVFNNLIYDMDTGGVSLRAKTPNNKVFNNTIAKVAGKGVGTGIDFQKDDNEAALPDSNNNGILDGQEDVENNVAFNNIVSLTPGTNRCLDLEGYDADTSASPVTPDLSNKSDYNLYYKCGRVALFNSQSYTDGQFTNYVAATSSVTGLSRDSHSVLIPAAQTLFVNSENDDYRLQSTQNGACRLGTNCPWSP